jgi:hypothetical protein
MALWFDLAPVKIFDAHNGARLESMVAMHCQYPDFIGIELKSTGGGIQGFYRQVLGADVVVSTIDTLDKSRYRTLEVPVLENGNFGSHFQP